MKSFLSKYKVEILSFFVPIIIFGIAFAFAGLWPFGKTYAAAYDGSAQYPGFSIYLINVLKGKSSLFYSFKGGLGFNFYATAIYYLFNPTNLLSIFFNKDNIMVFYTLIVFLRIGLCGFTMSKYLKYKDKSGKAILLFSIAYALIAYNVLYFYNFMYFDTVVLLPLVILGLDKLIDKKSPKLYIIFLTLAIISNFYIGSMVCIFSLLYFIYRYICLEKEKRSKKIIYTFIISSLLSGITASFVLLPVFFELMAGKVNLYGSNYTIYNKWEMDFFVSFYRLSIAAYSQGDQANGAPNIYSSLFVVIYTILFFFNKNIKTKEKIATGVFIAFFLLCFSYNLLDYAWQFFQRPIWYPNRYSFVFSFLLITTAYKSFNLKNSIKINNFVTIIVSLLLLALIVNAAIYSKIIDEDISKIILLILSCICVIEYMISFNLKKLSILIALIFILEVSANTVVGVKQISFAKTEPSYSILNKELSKSFDYIEETDPIQNNFYRMDSSNWTNINNGGSFNYNSLIYFNSLRNGKMMYFLEHYADYTVQDGCSTRFNAKNPIFTSLLGFKYIVSNKEEFYYDKIYEAPYSIYKIEENLSLGFMMNSKIKDLKLEDNKSYENSINIIDYSTNIVSNALTNFDYNELIKYWIMEEEDGTFVYYNSQEGGYVSYRGVIEKDAFVFLNPSMKGRNQYNLILNDEEEIKSFDTKNFTPLLLKKGDKYEIKLYFSSSREKVEDLKLYFLDYSSYINWVNEMKENRLEILKYEKDNYIKGKVMVNEDKTTLFTSIPYDKGWRVSVDGKNVSYNLLMDAFIGIDLTKGEHIIEFKYIPRGFIWGSIISILSLGTTIIYLKKRKV